MPYKTDHIKVLKVLGSSLPKRIAMKTSDIVAKGFKSAEDGDRRVRNAYRMLRKYSHIEIAERGDYRLTQAGAAFYEKMEKAGWKVEAKKPEKAKTAKKPAKPAKKIEAKKPAKPAKKIEAKKPAKKPVKAAPKKVAKPVAKAAAKPAAKPAPKKVEAKPAVKPAAKLEAKPNGKPAAPVAKASSSQLEL